MKRLNVKTVWFDARTRTIGIYTVWNDGFTEFELDYKSGPVDGCPTDWNTLGGTWILLGAL